jgi:hypothetical protein
VINDKLPTLHQPLVDLIRSIAPDVKVELCTTTEDKVTVDCYFGGRSVYLRHNTDGDWCTHHTTLETEFDLVERLCWLVDAPRMAGPADIAELQVVARDRENVRLYDQCSAALTRMDSAAILACSRALPNNDWRKHAP